MSNMTFKSLFKAIVSSMFKGFALESIVVGGRRIPCIRLAGNSKLELVIVAKSGSAPEGFKAFCVTTSESEALDTYYDKANEAGITVKMTAAARLQAIARSDLRRANRQQLEIGLRLHFTSYLTDNFDKVADIDNVIQCQKAFVGLSNSIAQMTWLLKEESEAVVQVAYLTQTREVAKKADGKDSKEHKAAGKELAAARSPIVDRRSKKFPKVADTTDAS